MNSSALESVTALTILLSTVFSLVLYVWAALALSAMFRKMGEEPWKGWVPFLNVATVLTWGGFSPWLVLIGLVPIVGAIALFVLIVVSAHRINPGFGYGTGMTVLAALVFVVWASILGFGPARWLGARAAGRSGAASRPPVPAAPAVPPPPAVASLSTPRLIAPDGLPAAPATPAPPTAPAASFAAPPAAPTAPPPAPTTAAFAPPPTSAAGWTPPETAPRADLPAPPPVAPPVPPVAPVLPPAPPAPASAPAFPPASLATPAAVDPAEDEIVAASDADWPSEIDDVSAIYPSPFPPSSASGRPYVAPPVGSDEGPIAFVPGRRVGSPQPSVPAPVTDVPGAHGEVPVAPPAPAVAVPSEPAEAPAPAPAATPEQGQFRARRAYLPDDAFPEMSGEVSAVIGSPTAGTPRSATGAVSAQHRRAEAPIPLLDAVAAVEEVDEVTRISAARRYEDIDETVIARRSVRPTWELIPVSGSPIPLTAAVVILGRRPAGDAAYPNAQLVAVQDGARTVSKTHARIELRGDAWIVTDLGSTNGVLVRTLMGDEVEVEPGGQLDAGERFFLGDEEFHLRRIAP